MDILTKHYRVIAPDIRGGGTAHTAGPTTFDMPADDVAALIGGSVSSAR